MRSACTIGPSLGGQLITCSDTQPLPSQGRGKEESLNRHCIIMMKKIEIEIPEGKEVADWGPEGGRL